MKYVYIVTAVVLSVTLLEGHYRTSVAQDYLSESDSLDHYLAVSHVASDED
jgi:hypothetical protein